jgi:ABC-type nitrate/sulfonate/bicarbonate transport system substrate-binding protein
MRMSLKVFACVLAGSLLLLPKVQAADKVRIGFPVQIHTANILLLQEYAKRTGVELDAAVMRGYPSIQLALVTNEIDLAVLGFVNIGLMEEKGFKNHRIVAGVFSGAQSLTLRNGVVARNWRDLEGKRIGTAPNTYADLLFKASAKLGGAELSKIKTVNFSPPGGEPVFIAMRDADIDGFVFWEPNNAAAVLAKLGYYSGLDLGDNPTRHINGALAVNSEYATKNQRVVASVVKALVEATEALNSDPSRFAEVAQKATGASMDVVKEAIPHGKLDYKLYQKEAKALMRMIHEAGITAIDASAAVDRTFDYSFLVQGTDRPKGELGSE